ncbi:18116_t:CDS:2 [Entrophospora sp. SA101]|nr:18116_t:CDS:2 [Entrophospora sp. SA101]
MKNKVTLDLLIQAKDSFLSSNNNKNDHVVKEIDKLTNSYLDILQILHSLINCTDDNNKDSINNMDISSSGESNIKFILSLLLRFTPNIHEILPPRQMVKCCEEIMSIWFDLVENTIGMRRNRDWPLKSSDLEEKEKLTELEFNRLRKLDKSRISENAKIFIANKNSRLLRCCTLKSDLLEIDKDKMNILVKIFIDEMVTVEPPTLLTDYILIVPKPIPFERDNIIQKKFYDSPELWDLLQFITYDYDKFEEVFDLILRPLLAINIGFWYRVKDQNPNNYPLELKSSERLLEMMKTAKYLPEPLNHVGKLFPHITSNDIGYLLFECIWKFIMENRQQCPYSDDDNDDNDKLDGFKNYWKRIRKLKLTVQKNIMMIPQEIANWMCSNVGDDDDQESKSIHDVHLLKSINNNSHLLYSD